MNFLVHGVFGLNVVAVLTAALALKRFFHISILQEFVIVEAGALLVRRDGLSKRTLHLPGSAFTLWIFNTELDALVLHDLLDERIVPFI